MQLTPQKARQKAGEQIYFNTLLAIAKVNMKVEDPRLHNYLMLSHVNDEHDNIRYHAARGITDSFVAYSQQDDMIHVNEVNITNKKIDIEFDVKLKDGSWSPLNLVFDNKCFA